MSNRRGNLEFICMELERSLSHRKLLVELLRDSSLGVSMSSYNSCGGRSGPVSDFADKIALIVDLEEGIKRDQGRLKYLYGRLAMMG